ncbi:MAG: hypothetical protein ACP5G4_10890 [bacterium]
MTAVEITTNPVGARHRRAHCRLTCDPVGGVRERPAGGRAVHEPPLQIHETIFRGPTREIALTNEYKPEKKHGWLDIIS